MSRILTALVVVFGLSAAANADDGPFRLLSTSDQAPSVTQALNQAGGAVVTPVQYRYYSYYPGYYNNGYRRYPGYCGGYYRPYYTRGWRDGYAFPLGRRWGLF
jgi:hypothetical protein